MAFATLTLCQLFHAFDVRSDHLSIFDIGICSNPAMIKAFAVGLLLQLSVLLLPPLQGVFQVVSLTGVQWITVGALSILPLFVWRNGKVDQKEVVNHGTCFICRFKRGEVRGGAPEPFLSAEKIWQAALPCT